MPLLNGRNLSLGDPDCGDGSAGQPAGGPAPRPRFRRKPLGEQRRAGREALGNAITLQMHLC
jgi:hypothetical protein